MDKRTIGMLVRKGLSDKEIAEETGIRLWLVRRYAEEYRRRYGETTTLDT